MVVSKIFMEEFITSILILMITWSDYLLNYLKSNFGFLKQMKD
jgi:hypothetical protein